MFSLSKQSSSGCVVLSYRTVVLVLLEKVLIVDKETELIRKLFHISTLSTHITHIIHIMKLFLWIINPEKKIQKN